MNDSLPDPLQSRSALCARLRAALGARVAAAEASGQSQLLALRVALGACDPLAAYAAWEGDERFYWERPADRSALVARGCVWALEVAGPGRFREASRRARELFSRLDVAGVEAPQGAGPLLVGGFSFADEASRADAWASHPAGRLVLPELLISAAGERAWCTVSRLIQPGSPLEDEWGAMLAQLEAGWAWQGRAWCDAPAQREGEAAGPAESAPFASGAEYRVVADRAHSVYRGQVASALDCVADGELEKVVLARSLGVHHPGRFELPRFLDRLRGLYPACVTFAVGRGEESFVAASPERLVSLRGGAVESGALAGSAPRGRTPGEDERLGLELRESKKDQAEHAAVVRAIRAALAGVCGPIEGPETPGLMRLEGIQHLFTPLRGRLCSEAAAGRPTVLDLVGRLHPTPAVGGLPREGALAWLDRCEGLDRGWYAGPVGFVDASGGGEFWVALRSALIRNPTALRVRREAVCARARLFAGAGIVLGSDPELELRETRLKLRALLAPLTEI